MRCFFLISLCFVGFSLVGTFPACFHSHGQSSRPCGSEGQILPVAIYPPPEPLPLFYCPIFRPLGFVFPMGEHWERSNKSLPWFLLLQGEGYGGTAWGCTVPYDGALQHHEKTHRHVTAVSPPLQDVARSSFTLSSLLQSSFPDARPTFSFCHFHAFVLLPAGPWANQAHSPALWHLGSEEPCRWFSYPSCNRQAELDAVKLLMQLGVV